jgi:hypothetical protein
MDLDAAGSARFTAVYLNRSFQSEIIESFKIGEA